MVLEKGFKYEFLGGPTSRAEIDGRSRDRRKKEDRRSRIFWIQPRPNRLDRPDFILLSERKSLEGSERFAHSTQVRCALKDFALASKTHPSPACQVAGQIENKMEPTSPNASTYSKASAQTLTLSCRTLLWGTLVGHSCRTILVGHSGQTLFWHTLVCHSCGTLLSGILAGHCCGTLL